MMYKEYEVTITPKITTYAGSSTFGEYTVTVTAKSHAEALKQARAEPASSARESDTSIKRRSPGA